MKENNKLLIYSFLAIVLTVMILVILSFLTMRKDGYHKYQQFFCNPTEYDVIMLGNSHMMNGFYPMIMWEQNGITSYNFGSGANTMPLNYWVLINVLDYMKPQLVVIDCSCITQPEKTVEEHPEVVHKVLDPFPLSINKISAISDLFEENESLNETAKKLDYIWPYSIYHNRWFELKEEDSFFYEMNIDKGAEEYYYINYCEGYSVLEEDVEYGILDEDSYGVIYLRKIIELCKENDIEVLLVFLPYIAPDEGAEASKAISKISEEYEVNYLNMIWMDVVDYKTDTRDGAHLNIFGAEKTTLYLGDYIADTYGICSSLDEKTKARWDGEYIIFCNKLEKGFEESEYGANWEE